MLEANLRHSKVLQLSDCESLRLLNLTGVREMVTGDNLLCRINGFVNVSDGDYDVITSIQRKLRL